MMDCLLHELATSSRRKPPVLPPRELADAPAVRAGTSVNAAQVVSFVFFALPRRTKILALGLCSVESARPPRRECV